MRIVPSPWFREDCAEIRFVRGLPPDLSSAALAAGLAEISAMLPTGPMHERIFICGSNISEDRRRDWELSRYALLESLRGLQERGFNLEKVGSRVRMSLSHTSGAALALAVASSSGECPRYGVDIELSNRNISDSAFRRFASAREVEILPEALDLWLLKESCVKVCPEWPRVLVSQFKIAGRTPVNDEFDLISTDYPPKRFQGILFSYENYRIGIARGVFP